MCGPAKASQEVACGLQPAGVLWGYLGRDGCQPAGKQGGIGFTASGCGGVRGRRVAASDAGAA